MFFISFTASKGQVLAYLFGVALFSISFLVFLNSAVSFVITERIGQKENVGDAVGTLGFVDELVALVACPFWGIMSDRIGVRAVAVIGYTIVGLSLYIFVQANNVYPQLILARLFFSVGGAATATMVTAVLPSMTFKSAVSPYSRSSNGRTNTNRHSIAPSISSELTITPDRFRRLSPSSSQEHPGALERNAGSSTSRLAGLVGMFTGLGALIALLVFLPLPTRFQRDGQSPSDSIVHSFYVVGAVAFVVAIGVFFGLRNLPGESNKSIRHIFKSPSSKYSELAVGDDEQNTATSYSILIKTSLKLALQDSRIFLGYLGGFVARASSVAISLFIPLFCNAYFISTGRCPSSSAPNETLPPDFKESCRRAYTIAAILSGTSQLVALISAPIFGYASARSRGSFNVPLIVAAIAGMAGYASFALIKSPDPKTEDGSGAVFFVVALLGISQIGAIVCSLSLLSHGINGDAVNETSSQIIGNGNHAAPSSETQPGDESAMGIASEDFQPATTTSIDVEQQNGETDPLMPAHLRSIAPSKSLNAASRSHLKGTIAGLYSFFGGAGILLLTKLGGWLFDEAGRGAPFWLMAAFNFIMFVGAAGVGTATRIRAQGEIQNRDD